MFKLLLLFLTLSGLEAVPLAAPVNLHETSSNHRLSDGFEQDAERSHVQEPAALDLPQGAEPSARFLVHLNTGLVREHIDERDSGAAFQRSSLGKGEMDRRHYLTDEVPVDVPAEKNGGGGWVRVEEPSDLHLPDDFTQGTEPFMSIPDGFRQGTEPVRSIPDGFRQGTEPARSIPDGFRQGTEPIRSIPDGFRQGTEPARSIPDGFRQGTEPIRSIPDGFRQGTEPARSIPDGFRQGTEPIRSIPDGFRQGTEPARSIPEGFRQGTEPARSIPDGFRQGTEPARSIPEGFRQGTEPARSVPDDFTQGTEPLISIPSGFTQGTEPAAPGLQIAACKGEVVNGKCYEFNPRPMAFRDARALCRALAPNADLASVTDGDLHSRLVSLVTKGGERDPALTWLGGIVQNQQASWVDGSEWNYSDWMPGHPNIHTDKPVCVEMFKIDESWWTATDCELKRASLCSYPIAA